MANLITLTQQVAEKNHCFTNVQARGD